MAVGDQFEKVMTELKSTFQFNNKFRSLFPEYCAPAKRAADFGTQDAFTIPCRSFERREPTVSCASIGRVIASSHYDVMKFSDIVDANNIRTPGQIEEVKSFFRYCEPLLERYTGGHPGWKYLEGTPYDFGDQNASLMEDKDWHKLIESAMVSETQTLWPARFTVAELERTRRQMTASQFSSQYLMKPIPAEGALAKDSDIQWFPRAIIGKLSVRLFVTIDLASIGGTARGPDTDYSVLCLHGFDTAGRLYILEIHRGRFSGAKVIDLMFDLARRHQGIVNFKFERGPQYDGLAADLKRERERRRHWLSIVEIPRSSRVSKQNRIKGLQIWFERRNIRFCEDIGCKSELLHEILRFPSNSAGVHDDILDCLADALTNSEGGPTDEVLPEMHPDMLSSFGEPRKQPKFTGFDEAGNQTWDGQSDAPAPFVGGHRNSAGAL